MFKLTHILLPLAAFTVAFAQPQAGAPVRPTFDNIKTYLGLSDTTLQNIQQTIGSKQSTIQALAQQMGEKHKAVATLLANGTTDAAAVGKLILEAEAIRKQISTQHDALQSSVLALLTADQKSKLKALEDAAKLAPAIQEAAHLHLIAQVGNPGAGPGMPFGGGPGMRMGQGPMNGPGMGNGFGPAHRTPRN